MRVEDVLHVKFVYGDLLIPSVANIVDRRVDEVLEVSEGNAIPNTLLGLGLIVWFAWIFYKAKWKKAMVLVKVL